MISANCVAERDRGKGLPVLSARQFIGAATTALSLITGAFLLALAAGNARAQGSAPACDAAGEIAVLPSPWAPWKGAPLRVMLVTEKPLQGELSLTGPDGSVAATSRERHGGPPYFWFTEIKAPAAGSWHATLTPQQAGAGCGITREIKVRADKPGGPGSAAGSTWPLAQRLESRKREPVLRLDREAVRRSARCGAVVAGVARGRARPLAQFPVQPSRPQRRR